MGSTSRPFFFVHVMKTAGATFRHHIRANFASAEVYPDKRFDPDLTVANVRLDYLTSLPASRRAAIRAYTGHFPFVATDLLGGPLLTMTILRDPVDRTISFLKHCKRYNQHHHDLRLEAIYEDPFVFRCLIQNHQAKLFALGMDDRPRSYMHVIDVDDDRLTTAKTNLQRIDVLALHEQFDALMVHMRDRFGWQIRRVPNRHVSEPVAVARSFRRRIADDNAADVAFYDYARQLYGERQRGA
jgi:hypothetical protein